MGSNFAGALGSEYHEMAKILSFSPVLIMISATFSEKCLGDGEWGSMLASTMISHFELLQISPPFAGFTVAKAWLVSPHTSCFLP